MRVSVVRRAHAPRTMEGDTPMDDDDDVVVTAQRAPAGGVMARAAPAVAELVEDAWTTSDALWTATSTDALTYSIDDMVAGVLVQCGEWSVSPQIATGAVTQLRVYLGWLTTVLFTPFRMLQSGIYSVPELVIAGTTGGVFGPLTVTPITDTLALGGGGVGGDVPGSGFRLDVTMLNGSSEPTLQLSIALLRFDAPLYTQYDIRVLPASSATASFLFVSVHAPQSSDDAAAAGAAGVYSLAPTAWEYTSTADNLFLLCNGVTGSTLALRLPRALWSEALASPLVPPPPPPARGASTPSRSTVTAAIVLLASALLFASAVGALAARRWGVWT